MGLERRVPEAETEIVVEVRVSDEGLARRISGWLEKSAAFVAGAAKGSRSVMIADHIPDDVEAPLIVLAPEDGPMAWPWDSRVAARLDPDIGPVKLRIAVEAAAHGMLIGEARSKASRATESPTALTGRELEVLRHIAEGASNKAIARALGISSHTVKFHVAAILAKLGVDSRTEAALQAIRLVLFML